MPIDFTTQKFIWLKKIDFRLAFHVWMVIWLFHKLECPPFICQNYEFDIGVHYIGDVGSQTPNKTILDQITEGQLEWEPLDDPYDVVNIGYGDDKRYKMIWTFTNLRSVPFAGSVCPVHENLFSVRPTICPRRIYKEN